MNKDLQKKLQAYAAAAGTIALAGTANAQVIYHDINPDTVAHDSTIYALDFDNNGQPELTFYTDLYQTSYGAAQFAIVKATGNASNAVIGSLYSSQYPLPFTLNNGDSISSTNTNWQSDTLNNGVQYLGVVFGSYTAANWVGQTDKYLGVRFMIGANLHYGWVRLSVNAAADSIIIKDYAYELLPGVGLTAGQMVGIPQYSDNKNIRIFASENTVVIHNSEAEKGGIVRITNTMGQTIAEEAVTSESMRISMEGKSTGMYFVEVIRNDEHFTKKVYIR